MQVFEDPAAWRKERIAQIAGGLTLGFVPTMGALHEGHLSLIRRSRAENDRTLASIFVNPTQFNDPEDLSRYPRPLDEDLSALRAAGTDFVLVPAAPDMYPDRFRYKVIEREMATVLEGSHRPGHFDGVLTVVMKLFALAQPDRAYFGEKDWQQLRLVQGMVDAFLLSITVVPCPTIREPDGLAMSSRNRLLSPADRRRAPLLYQTLTTARNADDAARSLRAAGFDVDYVEDREGRRLAAVRLGGVRLIDNVPV